MGYGMARNLRSKIDKDTTLVVCDVNPEAIDKFKSEMSDHGPIEVAKNGFEAVQKAVSGLLLALTYCHCMARLTDECCRIRCSP